MTYLIIHKNWGGGSPDFPLLSLTSDGSSRPLTLILLKFKLNL